MKKKLDLSVVLFLLVVCILGTYTISYMFFSDDWSTLSRKNDGALTKLSEAMDVIEAKYVGDYDEKAIVDGAIEGMITSLEDRWSFYLNNEQLKEYYLNMNNQYSGVGIVIEKKADIDGIFIASVHKNSPAHQAGIMPESIIIRVDGVDIKEIELQDASAMMGEKIKEGKLLLDIVDKDGIETSITLIPRVIEVDPVNYEMIEEDIGMIKIDNFDAKSSEQIILAIQELSLKGAKGFIFDVRNNPGGKLAELLIVLDYLLPEGTTFISRTKGEESHIEVSDANCLDVPMVVLVNTDSYSAAEFFAAALQEYEWAVIVGQQTTGKGYAQITVTLSDESAIHISASEYFTPKGESLAGVGITPDVALNLDDEKNRLLYYGRLDYSEDEQLQKAIEEFRKLS